MDSFRLLLNEISHELTDQNLQSLIHIYKVPGGVKNKIHDGLALFDYMITQDFISREKIGNVRELMRKIRPRRKDLVRLVDNYIKKEFKTDDIRSVLDDDLSDSWEQISEIQRQRGSPVAAHQETVVCKIDCVYLNCACRRMPSCYAPVVLLIFFSIIVTVVFWYAPHVPGISEPINSNAKLKRVGVYIILLEILVLLVVIGLCIRKKLASYLPCKERGSNIQESTSQPMVTPRASIERLQRSVSRPQKFSFSDSAVFNSSERDSIHTFYTSGTNDNFLDSSGPEA